MSKYQYTHIAYLFASIKILTECMSNFFPLKFKEEKALGFYPAYPETASIFKGTIEAGFEVGLLNLNL